MGQSVITKPGDRVYNIAVQQLNRSQQIIVQNGCAGFMFTNIGDTRANVNGMTINPSVAPATILGDSRSIALHKNDIFKGNLTLTFEAPLGAAPLVEIIQLFYADYQ